MTKVGIGLCVIAAGFFGACTSAPPLQMTTQFNPSEVAWSRGSGTNSIVGNAVLRTVGGEVRTCAGFEAGLSPVSTYSTERMRLVFGNDQRGYTTNANIAEPDLRWREYNRVTTCDSQGNFRFSNLPDGAYYVVTLVTWGVPNQYFTSTQGGGLMQQVSVRGGESKSIVMTAQ